ncbi:hypothetical protein BDQ17DRAFT_1366383, partial [Cyathus striatus]
MIALRSSSCVNEPVLATYLLLLHTNPLPSPNNPIIYIQPATNTPILSLSSSPFPETNFHPQTEPLTPDQHPSPSFCPRPTHGKRRVDYAAVKPLMSLQCQKCRFLSMVSRRSLSPLRISAPFLTYLPPTPLRQGAAPPDAPR